MIILKLCGMCLLFSLFTGISGLRIRFIAPIVGSSSQIFGFERLGSAYDVAVEQSIKMYPAVFQNFSMTRYFIPGNFTCAESDAEITTGLGKLFIEHLNNFRLTGGDQEPELRVILSPGCTFESITLGDFAREENVILVQSSSSLDILNDRKRFPTLVPMAALSYNNVALAMLAIMRRYGWTRFNALCDTNQRNPHFFLLDVSCSIFQRTFQTTEISMTYTPFNSENKDEIKATLSRCRIMSTISVVASVTAVYEKVLTLASAMGMANGDYVFYLLPLDLFTEFEEIVQSKLQVSTTLSNIIPFVFILSFDEINWEAVSTDVTEMANVSKWRYNLTVTPEVQRNAGQLAAYESVMILTKVLNENLAELKNMSATKFTSRFFNRTFDLPSRLVTLNAVGRRECNIIFKQFRNETEKFEPVLVRGSASKRLVQVNNSKVHWSGVTFPPGVTPICGFDMELCLGGGYFTTTVAIIIVFAVGLFGTFIGWKYLSGQGSHDRWWMLIHEFLVIPRRKQDRSDHVDSIRSFSLV